MSDLIERLRSTRQRKWCDQNLFDEAADEIERLQKAYRPADMLEYQKAVAEIERLQKLDDDNRQELAMADKYISKLEAALEDDEFAPNGMAYDD